MRAITHFLQKLFLSVLAAYCTFSSADDSLDDVNCDAPWVENRAVYEAGNFYEFVANRLAGEGLASTADIRRRSCLRDAGTISAVKNLLIIDVRPSEKFNAGNIPGSVNLPLYELKTKNLFKKRPILIVDDKNRYFDHLQLCETLPLAGFLEVYLLNGGYQGWVKSGELDNERAVGQGLSMISPLEFIKTVEMRSWVILDFSERNNTWQDRVFRVRMDKENQDVVSNIKNKFDDFVKLEGVAPRMLIIDESGNSYSRIVELLSDQLLEHSYFLEGGLSSFDKELEKQKLIREEKKVTTSGQDFKCY